MCLNKAIKLINYTKLNKKLRSIMNCITINECDKRERKLIDVKQEALSNTKS